MEGRPDMIIQKGDYIPKKSINYGFQSSDEDSGAEEDRLELERMLKTQGYGYFMNKH